MKRIVNTFLIACLVITMSTGVVLAEDKPSSPENVELTKDQVIDRLNTVFKYNPEVVPSIQGLRTEKDAEGNINYIFDGKKIEDLDKDTLEKFLRNANSQVSWKNYERMQGQMKSLKQMEQLEKDRRAQQQLRSLKQIQDFNKSTRSMNTPNIPKTYNPPKIPRTTGPTSTRRY